MSFTAGQVGMLGGVLGSLFILRMGIPALPGLVLTLAACAAIGVVTEIVAVRPVLQKLDQHLYVLSTLALALMIQQVAAVEWSTEPQPFPRLLGIGERRPARREILAARRSLRGRRARARVPVPAHHGRATPSLPSPRTITPPARSGLPERQLRMLSFALASAIGGLAGFAAGELLLAFFANGPLLNFYGFVPVAIGGLGNNRGTIVGGLALGLIQQTANFLFGGVFASVAVFVLFIVVLLSFPQGLFGSAVIRRV